MADNSNKNAANSQFRKLRQAEEGKRAMLDYENNAAANRAKTARLRALRLARDAEEAAAAALAPPPVKKKKRPRKKKSDNGRATVHAADGARLAPRSNGRPPMTFRSERAMMSIRTIINGSGRAS